MHHTTPPVQRLKQTLIDQLLILQAVLTLAIVFSSAPAKAASALSTWLNRTALPELRSSLSTHPRYDAQTLVIRSESENDLAAAVTTVLQQNLINTLPETVKTAPHAVTFDSSSIDTLNCSGVSQHAYTLLVTTHTLNSDRVQLRLNIVDARDPTVVVQQLSWLGTLSRDERRSLKRRETLMANGSMTRPWSNSQLQPAIVSISQQLACALRPQLKSQLSLFWQRDTQLPELLANAAIGSEHLLGQFPELYLGSERSDLLVTTRAQPMGDGLWQFWLIGTPTQNGLTPVQAVTYFRGQNNGLLPALASTIAMTPAPATPAPKIPYRAAVPASAGDAIDHLKVSLVNVSQSEKRRSRAILMAAVELTNTSSWPIDYSLTLSGGHFNHCIARPAHYRHDRFGTLQGQLQAGETRLQRLQISDTTHRPTPLLGIPKCAGFRDLEGLEDFATQGYRVTDYVRWTL